MGIDMATREEQIAADNSPEEIRDHVGADSLAYISIEAIAETIDTPGGDLCLACVTGEYPYDIAGEETDRSVARPDVGNQRAPADD
jgi:amidophosphoribosyltransferase